MHAALAISWRSHETAARIASSALKSRLQEIALTQSASAPSASQRRAFSGVSICAKTPIFTLKRGYSALTILRR
jgi:hypothetical protein